MLLYNLKAIHRYRLDRDRFLTGIIEGTTTLCVLPCPFPYSVTNSQWCLLHESLFWASGDKIYNNTSERGPCKLITLMATSAQLWDNIQSHAKHYFPPRRSPVVNSWFTLTPTYIRLWLGQLLQVVLVVYVQSSQRELRAMEGN